MAEIRAADVIRIVLGSGQPHLVICACPFATATLILKAAGHMREAAKQTGADSPEVMARIDSAEHEMLRNLHRPKPKRRLIPHRRYPNLRRLPDLT